MSFAISMTEPGFRPARLATQAMFLMCGTVAACWGALVPLVKARLGLSDGELGMLLLAPGFGAILSTPLSSALLARAGGKPAILLYGTLAMLAPVLLALAPSRMALAVALLLFGATMSGFGVSINAQAMAVERLGGRRLMSSFHAMFSLGGLSGSLLCAALLSMKLPPAVMAAAVTVMLLGLLSASHRALLPDRADDHVATDAPDDIAPRRARRRRRGPGIDVLLPGLMILVMYLSEAALLDWGAVFLHFQRGWSEADAPMGYAVFSTAMTVGRLTGDRLIDNAGPVRVMVLGALLAAAGFMTVVLAPVPAVLLLGFLLIGLGAANIVPLLMSAAGRLPLTPKALAIPAVSAMGSSGLLMGPGAIGLVSQYASLATALAMLGGALAIVAIGGVKLRKYL